MMIVMPPRMIIHNTKTANEPQKTEKKVTIKKSTKKLHNCMYISQVPPPQEEAHEEIRPKNICLQEISEKATTAKEAKQRKVIN